MDDLKINKGKNKNKSSGLIRFLFIIIILTIITVGNFIFERLEAEFRPTKEERISNIRINVVKNKDPGNHDPGRWESMISNSCSKTDDCFGDIGRKFNMDEKYNAISRQLKEIEKLHKQILEQKDNRCCIDSKDSSLQLQMESIIKKINPQIKDLVETAEEASRYIEKDIKVKNEFRLCLFLLLFITPLILLSFLLYLKFKNKDSNYAGIFGAFLVAFFLLSLQVFTRLFTVFEDIYVSSASIIRLSILVMLIIGLGYVAYIAKCIFLNIQISWQEFFRLDKGRLIILGIFLFTILALFGASVLISKYVGDYPASSPIESFLIPIGFLFGLIFFLFPAWLLGSSTGIRIPFDMSGGSSNYFSAITIFIFVIALFYITLCLFARIKYRNQNRF